MGEEPDTKEKRDTGSILFALIVAGIIVAAGAVAYVVYTNSQRIGGGGPYAIEPGDTVTLNYIGRFSDGRIFDTSLWSVAEDDANYSKSLTFSLRSKESYEPFSMTAGKYGEGGTIKGFALGVIGLHMGDYSIIEVAPEDAYSANSEMLTTTNLTQTLFVKEQYATSSFRSYFGADPIPLSTISHFFWKWKVQVASVEGDIVTILNQPEVGSSAYPFGDPTADDPSGWEVRVIAYDALADNGNGTITVRNMLSAEDAYNIKGTDSDGGVFIVSACDEVNGTFQIHRNDSATGYNGEIAGRALFFEVTIVKVEPEES